MNGMKRDAVQCILSGTGRLLLPGLCLAALCLAPNAGHGASTGDPMLPPLPVRLSPEELEIWQNPAFKRDLALSYMAETEIEPRVTEEEREQLLKVFELIQADNLDAAARELEKMKNEASSAVVDFTLANIFFQREQLDQAEGLYQEAVAKHAKFRRAYENLGKIHMRKGEHAKAIPELTKVIELGGGDALTYGLLGFAYSSVENSISAESAYRMAILLDPVTMDWKMGLARSFFRQERYGEAAALCGMLLKDQPDRADLWLLQANAYIGLKQPLEAAKNFELVDRLGQSTPDSLNTLGDIYVNDGLYDLAVKYYGAAMQKDASATPDRAIRSAKVIAARGAFDETKKLVEQIEGRFGKGLKDDQRKDLLKLQARLAVASGSGDEEARVLEEIVKIDPLDGEALILLGQHAARNDDTERAIFYYERAAAIEKHEADACLRHAQLLVDKSQYSEALPLLRRAQQINPRENVQQFLESVERVAGR